VELVYGAPIVNNPALLLNAFICNLFFDALLTPSLPRGGFMATAGEGTLGPGYLLPPWGIAPMAALIFHFVVAFRSLLAIGLVR
jgi:hypothetical protein